MSDRFDKMVDSFDDMGVTSKASRAALLRGVAREAAAAMREEIAKRFEAMPLLAKGVREVPLVLHEPEPSR